MELCLWGIGLWVTILVSSQLRYSIDHRGESLTVPHPRRVSTPLMAAMEALPCRSSDKSMAAQAREFGTSPRPRNLGRVPPGLCREFGKLTLTLTFLGKVSEKSMAALSVEPPTGSLWSSLL